MMSRKTWESPRAVSASRKQLVKQPAPPTTMRRLELELGAASGDDVLSSNLEAAEKFEASEATGSVLEDDAFPIMQLTDTLVGGAHVGGCAAGGASSTIAESSQRFLPLLLFLPPPFPASGMEFLFGHVCPPCPGARHRLH